MVKSCNVWEIIFDEALSRDGRTPPSLCEPKVPKQ